MKVNRSLSPKGQAFKTSVDVLRDSIEASLKDLYISMYGFSEDLIKDIDITINFDDCSIYKKAKSIKKFKPTINMNIKTK